MSKYKYGFKPSLPDPRDILEFKTEPPAASQMPETFSLRPDMPAVYDQGQLGSCTANAIAGAYEFMAMDADLPADKIWTPSRLFIYYCERVREGTVNEDSGAYGRDGFASLRKTGVCPETMLPYDINRFTEKPTEECYTAAAENKIKWYSHAISAKNHIMGLILNRKPVAFGFNVFESFEGNECMTTGYMPMPGPNEKSLGGHEPLAIGWTQTHLECRNSWGANVQDDGYFWMPWEYVLGGYCSDFRAISALEIA